VLWRAHDGHRDLRARHVEVSTGEIQATGCGDRRLKDAGITPTEIAERLDTDIASASRVLRGQNGGDRQQAVARTEGEASMNHERRRFIGGLSLPRPPAWESGLSRWSGCH
jgi:hypothetical protein